MKKFMLVAALGSIALGGSVAAQTYRQAPAVAPDAPPPPPPGSGPGGRMGPMSLMRADLNGDGVITRAEAAQDADQRFAAMDLNHDGRVTPDERRAAMEQRRGDRAEAPAPRPGSDVRPPRPRDGDRGGWRGGGGREMTADDFRERELRLFDRVDTNHNGQVDRNEIEAAQLLMRARMAERRDGDRPPPPGEER